MSNLKVDTLISSQMKNSLVNDVTFYDEKNRWLITEKLINIKPYACAAYTDSMSNYNNVVKHGIPKKNSMSRNLKFLFNNLPDQIELTICI